MTSLILSNYIGIQFMLIFPNKTRIFNIKNYLIFNILKIFFNKFKDEKKSKKYIYYKIYIFYFQNVVLIKCFYTLTLISINCF